MNPAESISVALIVSTSGRAGNLALCLEHIAGQTRLPDEVIVADDGSIVGVKPMIQRLQSTFPVRLIRVWQEDHEPRFPSLFNLAIKAVGSKYVIHIGHHAIIGKHFIHILLKNTEPGFFITGALERVGPQPTKKMLHRQKTNHLAMHRGVGYHPVLYVAPFISRIFKKSVPPTYKLLKTHSDFGAFWKSDIYEVNGYNLDIMNGDVAVKEMAIRLMHQGVHNKRIFRAGIRVQKNDQFPNPENADLDLQILWETYLSGTPVCRNGIDHEVVIDPISTKLPLTAVIITSNDETQIENAIKSLYFINDIMIVDRDSTDRTVDVAHSMGVKVFQMSESEGSKPDEWVRRNAGNPWLLLLNANERVPRTLQDEIEQTLKHHPGEMGYMMPRLHYFLRKQIRHSGWKDDRVLRLIRKDHIILSGIPSPDMACNDQPVGNLGHCIVHNAGNSCTEFIRKLTSDTDPEGPGQIHTVTGTGIYSLALKPFFRFLKYYIVYRGFLDGIPGLTIAVFRAHGLWLRCIKIHMQKRSIPIHDDIH